MMSSSKCPYRQVKVGRRNPIVLRAVGRSALRHILKVVTVERNNSGPLNGIFVGTGKHRILRTNTSRNQGTSGNAGNLHVQVCVVVVQRGSPTGTTSTDFVLHHKPLIVSLDQFFNNIFFYLLVRILLQINPYPGLRKSGYRRIRGVCPVDKRDLEFSSVEFVGDDDAVAVSLQGSLSLGDEQSVVRLQLESGNDSAMDVGVSCGTDTLKDTTKPCRVHSATMGFKIFGTWSISMWRLPFPDWILWTDYAKVRRARQNHKKANTIFCLGKKKSLTAAAR